MKHYFVTPQDVKFPEDRFCAQCGEYLTHSNHPHASECPCLACQQERNLTQRPPDDCPRGGSHVYKWDGTLPTEEMIENAGIAGNASRWAFPCSTS